MVNIEGLKKAEVLAALYNGSRSLGMGMLQFTPELMTTEEAEVILKDNSYPYFDYIKGRVMKVDLSCDNVFKGHLYDRDNGEGTAQRVIDNLRMTIKRKSKLKWVYGLSLIMIITGVYYLLISKGQTETPDNIAITMIILGIGCIIYGTNTGRNKS